MAADRRQLLHALEQAVRKVGAQSVLISDLVAARVGLNSTDLECLDLLYLSGATTPGALARHTGLTTGATTAVVDRLERAGFVRRRRDGGDRRRVLVEVVPAGASRIQPLYERLGTRMAELNTQYTDDQLATIVDYLSRAFGAGSDHISWLQTQAATRRRTPRRRTRVARQTRDGSSAPPERAERL